MNRVTALGGCSLALAWSFAACSSNEDESKIRGGGDSGSSSVMDGGGMGSGGGPMFGGDGSSFGQNDGGNVEIDGSCGQSVIEADRRQVNMLLVLDISGSMLTTPAGFSSDKWTALKTALRATLDAAKADIDFGLQLFPFPENASQPLETDCEMPTSPGPNVPIESGSTGVSKILDALDDTTPAGGTPTAAALQRALDYFTTGAGATAEGDHVVLLATDGGPNCNPDLTCGAARCTVNLDGDCIPSVPNCCAGAAGDQCLDDAATVDRIEALAAEGISTFVVGIPGSEAYADYLNAFATAGGKPRDGEPKYFAVDPNGDVTGLTDVLQSITRQLITSCRLQLQSRPPNRQLLNVEIEGETLAKDGPDGWELDDSTDPPTIAIKGTTCQYIEQRGVESVRVVYGCPTIFIQ